MLLTERGQNTDAVWSSISTHEGSVQHLDFLDEHEKAVFRTAFELDQRWLIDLAGDRTPYVCQAQSLNIFVPADIHKRDLHQIHLMAWKHGVKSLYYCRSKSLQRPDVVATPTLGVPAEIVVDSSAAVAGDGGKYEECLACQ
jgi:ribonucleoside-diphosphate reductase alpha chain